MTRTEALALLGLSEQADRAELRHAYSEQSKRYHVETHPEEFTRLHEAYQLLLNSLKNSSTGMVERESHWQSVKPEQENREKSFLQTGKKEAEAKSKSERKSEQEAQAEQDGQEAELEPDKKLKPEDRTEQKNGEKSFWQAGKKEAEDSKYQSEIEEEQRNNKQFQEKTPELYEEILEELVSSSFSIANCQELVQLIYHLCRQEERNPEYLDQLLIRRGMATEIQERYTGMEPEWESVPDDTDMFLQIFWGEWTEQDWISLICHPVFIKSQYEEAFLEELCRLLQEETLNYRDGISQDLYFALCMAYRLFQAEPEGEERREQGRRQEASAPEWLIKLLFLHPRHQEYVQDLSTWEYLQQDIRLVSFCQNAVIAEEDHVLGKAEKELFLDEAEALFLENSSPRNEFILQNLQKNLSGTLFSFWFPQRRTEFQKFQARCEKCFRVFSDRMLDITKDGNSPYQTGYRTFFERLEQFEKKYQIKASEPFGGNGKRGNPIYSSWFIQSLKNYMVLSNYSTVYPYISYVVWRELCSWYSGESQVEQEVLAWLKSAAYFSAYERRWQRECIWRKEHIEEAYFQEAFPIPDLNQGKQDLLAVVRQGIFVEPSQVQMIFHNLSLDQTTADTFLTRLTNAMVQFKFLLVTQKQERNPVPEDAFCFLKEKVILYRKKENFTCQMSHPAFFDMLSRTVDLLGQHDGFPGAASGSSDTNKKSRYSDTFLETVCKNLYLYECYIRQR